MTSATKPQFDDANVAQIFTNVCVAMQDAEERHGPDSDGYLELMDAIIAECEQRKTNCYATNREK